MAIDTRDKRLSVLGWGLSNGRPLPSPDGLVGEGERRAVVGVYRGTFITLDWTNRASALNVGFAFFRPPGPYPDGALIARDRQVVAGWYWSISATGPTVSYMRTRALTRAIARSIRRSL